MTPQEIGTRGEENVETAIRLYGHRVLRLRGPFDLLVNGSMRIEVKTAFLNKKRAWTFNIHRHGKVSTDRPDAFILRLEGVPLSTYAIHFLIPGDYDLHTFHVGVRKLFNQRFKREVDAYYQFLKTGKLFP